MIIEQLTRKAKELPEPQRTNALGNVQDAWDDLVVWPEYSKKILADLQAAIEAHEVEAECMP